MAANLDLSVGPLMGLIVVVTSFFWATGQGPATLCSGSSLVIATALAVGLVNGLLVRVGRLPPVLATLATYIVIQGVGLQLRPQEAGILRPDITARSTRRSLDADRASSSPSSSPWSAR